jgi:hypothetical protein
MAFRTVSMASSAVGFWVRAKPRQNREKSSRIKSAWAFSE